MSIVWSTNSLTRKVLFFKIKYLYFASSNNELFEKKNHVCKFKLEFIFQKFCKTKKNGLLEKKKTKNSFFEHPKMEQDDEQEDDELR